VNRILAAADLPPVTRCMPSGMAFAAGACCEALWNLFRLPGEPPMTRFLARELATAHWFTGAAARRDLGYEPAVSLEEGLARLRQSLQGRGAAS
jgi:2-alkyl-3-oxoalkanoate reductase